MNIVKIMQYIAYKIVFDIIYINIVSENFEYMGLYKDFNSIKYIIGWLISISIILISQYIFRDRIYNYIVNILIFLCILPQISLWGIKNYSNESIIFMMLYWLIFISSLWLFRSIRLKSFESRLTDRRLSNNIFVILILIFSTIFILYVSGKYTGFRFTLNLDDVYRYRGEFSGMQTSMFVNYLLPLTSTVLLPYLFVIYMIEKKYKLLLITITLGLFAFSISGMKTWLFIYIIIIIICMLKNKKNIDIINVLLFILILFTIITIIHYFFTGDLTLVGLHNRMLSYPSELNFYYFNFFQEHEILYLRESILRYFFKSPYNIGAPTTIALKYAGGPSNAVNGLFGDAYANFGIIGIIIYPLLYAIIIRILVEVCKYFNDDRYLYSIFFILIWNCVNTSFFTWLVTGGVILYYIIITITKFGKNIRIKI